MMGAWRCGEGDGGDEMWDELAEIGEKLNEMGPGGEEDDGDDAQDARWEALAAWHTMDPERGGGRCMTHILQGRVPF